MKQLALAISVVAVLVGVVAIPASAGSFNDSAPCPASGSLLICPTGEVGKPYTLQLQAYGGCDIYEWAVVNSALPTGLSMSTSTGLITGTPQSAGRWVVWIEITDLAPSKGGYSWCTVVKKSEREFVISIDPGLSINNQSVKPGTVGQAYAETLTAMQLVTANPQTGPQAPATWSVQSGTLPPGVTLTPAGVLEGIPTTEGTYQFVVRAVNGSQSDTETLTIVVRRPVVVSSPFGSVTPPRSEVGVPFLATLTATGGTGTFTWALASGLLPDGLTFADGTISGTPLTAGRFGFSVSVTDSETRTTILNATLTVAAKLAITTLRLKPGKVGRLYKQKLRTSGGVLPAKWKIKGRLPRGIRFASALGMLTGTPRKAGTYRVTVEVTDAFKVKSVKKFTIVVLP